MLRILFWFVLTVTQLDAVNLTRSVIHHSPKISGVVASARTELIPKFSQPSTAADQYVANVLHAYKIKISPNSVFWDTNAILGILDLLEEGVPAAEILTFIPRANIAITFLLEASFKSARASHVQTLLQ